jgi:hypothetical protein
MAQNEEIEIAANIKSNIGEVNKDLDNAAKSTGKLEKSTKKAGRGFKGLRTAIRGVGTAIKRAGIGLLIAGVAALMEVFRNNQKVLDAFNTGMTGLSIAFNDLFKFLNENVGKVQGWFKTIFDDPQASLKRFGDAIQANLIERFNSLLDTFGYLGKALGELMDGEFANAWESVKEAGKEQVDVWTGVDNSVDKVKETIKETTEAIVEYVEETKDQAQGVTEVTKAAAKAAVEFAKLNAQYLRDAEIQRQLRDDETATFDERIKANQKLDEILAEQQKAQKAQVQLQIDAAAAQYNINKNDENYIALQEAKVSMLELEETITGQLSEQKTNQVALERELLETQNEVMAEGMRGRERELEELRAAYEQKKEMARKSGMETTDIDKQYQRQRTQIVQQGINDQVSAFSSLAGALSSLAGDNKELAAASAIMDTYVGANKAFAQGGVVGFVSAAAIIIAGLNNVKKIYATDVPGGGGGGAAPAAAQAPAPQMMSGAFDLSGGEAPDPLRAFVVTDEMTDSQNQLANIRRRSTI